MYSVHQHWDPLKVCVVGRSYPPEFYDYIKNKNVRKVFYRISEETEEDYQLLIKKLESFGVTVVRNNINDDREYYFANNAYLPPPMTPRDMSAMIGNKFYLEYDTSAKEKWIELVGASWPTCPTSLEEFNALPDQIKKILAKHHVTFDTLYTPGFQNVEIILNSENNDIVYGVKNINSAMCTRVGKDLYFGTYHYIDDINLLKLKDTYSNMFPGYRCHVINTGGHSDGTFCPVKPGLIVSLYDVPTYAETFPDWEVVYLPGQSWDMVSPFMQLKEKNNGKWWVPGEELNEDFTNYVETWMNHWVGYVEETVFDVNMLVIDEKNVICNNYNQQVFDAFDRHGITGHLVNFRHRYFWDGGLHCITSDLHREGTQKDYFPFRDLT